jgi:GTP 3',8-cyclase
LQLAPSFVAPTPTFHGQEVELINRRLAERGETLASAIRERSLYFRVSLLGSCNLSCPFCHNEGGPKKGKLDLGFALRAILAARDLGFERVQFTGGEPLLHPLVAVFVARSREIMDDVGITTNGTYLSAKLAPLVAAGLCRIHVSLQSESLRVQPHAGRWTIPNWLGPVLDLGRDGVLKVRLNLPVPLSDLEMARTFLVELAPFHCDVNLFAILPQGDRGVGSNSSIDLERLAADENERRRSHLIDGRILVRGYRPPTGIRCADCGERDLCKEQSHSLRLGADSVLRPCLASRRWDIKITDENLRSGLEEATALAIDYTWPSP